MAIKSMKMSWVVVSDLSKAIKFYTDVLGLKLKEKDEKFGWAELCGEMTEGACLGLAQINEHTPFPPGSNAVVCMDVENLEKTKMELIKKGVKFLGETMEVPGHVKLQSLVDEDGNFFQLVQVLHK